MLKPSVLIAIFIAQLLITVSGRELFDKYSNAILLYIVSILLPVLFILFELKKDKNLGKGNFKLIAAAIWFLAGVLIFGLAYEELRKLFVSNADPGQISDVIPQAKILFERFSNGEFPYQPINFGSYALEPVYMPLQWMPIALTIPFDIDVRWIGVIFFAIIVGIMGILISRYNVKIWQKLIALALPVLPMWGFIVWEPLDIAVTYEVIIASYYLMLAIGLADKNIVIVTAGIIACLLSRYTLLFWLPLFAILLAFNKKFKVSLIAWGVVLTSLMLFYIIPFYIKEPDAFNRGLEYYTGATIADWFGYGDPPVSWTQEAGISFAPHMRILFEGSIEEQVHKTRLIQGIVLLITFIIALVSYFRLRKRLDFFVFSLAFLHIILINYFSFAPLTYRYYLIPVLTISGVICAYSVLHQSERRAGYTLTE